MGPLASFRHPYCYQLVITSHFCVRKPNTSKADAHDPPPVASSLSGFQITVLPPQSPVPSLEAQLTCFPIMGRGGGRLRFPNRLLTCHTNGAGICCWFAVEPSPPDAFVLGDSRNTGTAAQAFPTPPFSGREPDWGQRKSIF